MLLLLSVPSAEGLARPPKAAGSASPLVDSAPSSPATVEIWFSPRALSAAGPYCLARGRISPEATQGALPYPRSGCWLTLEL
jgi:hypothetical protein